MAELGVVTRALLSLLDDGAGDRSLAERICRACVEGFGVDGAGISLLTASRSRETLYATDPVAELLEDLQFSLNEGVCMEAATTGSPVLVPDLHHSTQAARWPMFAAAVAEQTGIGALFALPLQWGTVNLGVLDLYRIVPGGLTDAQYRDAISAADTAALMLLGQRTAPGDPRGGGGWLDFSLSGRAEIHQATGMVLAQLGIGATDALARLRAHAFMARRPLIDIAHDVVARRLCFTPDMG